MLNDYQKGSLFGAVMIAVAFSAAFSTIPYLQRYPSDQPAANVKSNQQQRESFWEAAATDPVAVFTGSLVVVGGIQALLFLWQLDLIRAGLTEAKQSADAASNSADVAKEALELSRETAKRQLRAYVFVDDASVRSSPENGRASIVVIIKTFGSTPAINVDIRYNADIIPKIADKTILEPRENDLRIDAVIIAPGHSNMIYINFLALHSITTLRGKSVYVWGRADYTDAFGSAQFMTFQLYWSDPSVANLSVCPMGNTAS